jgi:hypothetical protein
MPEQVPPVFPGERIKIRAADGSRWWGRVSSVSVDTAMIDVTLGPESGVPDRHRVYAPGMTTVNLVVELEGPR